MPPSNSKEGTTPLASKPPNNATPDLWKGLRWRLKLRWNSPAWITAGQDAADMLLKEIASDKLRRQLRTSPTLKFPSLVVTSTRRAREKSRGGRFEEAARPCLHCVEEDDPPSDLKNPPRTRGGEQRRWRCRQSPWSSLLRKPSLDLPLPSTVQHGRASRSRVSMIWLLLRRNHIR
jgi:hypothetical protein